MQFDAMQNFTTLHYQNILLPEVNFYTVLCTNAHFPQNIALNQHALNNIILLGGFQQITHYIWFNKICCHIDEICRQIATPFPRNTALNISLLYSVDFSCAPDIILGSNGCAKD